MATPTGNYQFAFNGWLFGGLGQGVQILEVAGLEDMPSLRVQDDTRGFQDGMFTGRDFLNGRSITFTLQVMNDAADTMSSYIAALKSNLAFQQSGTGVLQFMLPGRALQRVNARVRRRSLTIDPDYTFGKSIAYVEFFCPDPRIYDDAAQGAVLTPGASSGRTYNRVYPLLYDSSTGTSTAVATFTNSGNVTTWPTFTLTGTMNTPQIRNQDTGQVLKINYVLGASETMVIDPDLRSVTINGIPARNLLDNASGWFGFPPGNTTVGIVAAGSPTGTLSVTYRNGYV